MAKHAATPEPTNQPDTTQPTTEQLPPKASPAAVEAILERLRQMADRVGLFDAARAIAENRALRADNALDQIRALYAEYDTKHPAAAQVVDQ